MPQWKRFHEDMMPKYPKEVKAEIAILDEMELTEDYGYEDADGNKFYTGIFRYPKNSISKFTETKGSKRFVPSKIDGEPDVFVDDRKFMTPHEGEKDNCFVSYYSIVNDKRKSFNCLPSAFGKLLGWKKGDGQIVGFPRPDTTPTTLSPKAQVEIERIRIEAEKAGAVKKEKAKAGGTK